MTPLISVGQFRRELRAKRKPSGPVFRISTEPPVPVAGADRTLRFCFSDSSVDRMGDTINALGWDITDFVRNPVALWAHDSAAPPIGGARNVNVMGNRLMGDIEFASPETYLFADTVYRLLLDRYLRAVSVGFLPTRYRYVQNNPARPGGIDFLEQSLIEISVVPVPANPNALTEARRKGIDTRPLAEWAERVLDAGGTSFLSNGALKNLRETSKEPRSAPVMARATRDKDTDLARAKEIRARITARHNLSLASGDPDLIAWQAEQESRRREQAAGAMRAITAVQWW